MKKNKIIGKRKKAKSSFVENSFKKRRGKILSRSKSKNGRSNREKNIEKKNREYLQ